MWIQKIFLGNKHEWHNDVSHVDKYTQNDVKCVNMQKYIDSSVSIIIWIKLYTMQWET